MKRERTGQNSRGRSSGTGTGVQRISVDLGSEVVKRLRLLAILAGDDNYRMLASRLLQKAVESEFAEHSVEIRDLFDGVRK